jgi:hypothetical protein
MDLVENKLIDYTGNTWEVLDFAQEIWQEQIEIPNIPRHVRQQPVLGGLFSLLLESSL